MAKGIDVERVKKCMKAFNLTEEQAIKMIEDDATIDAGGKCDWEKEMTPEQKKAVRQARMANRAVKTEKQTRTKAENPTKRALITELVAMLTDSENPHEIKNVEVLNPEREISFSCDGVVYKFTLSAPRIKKAE